MNTKVLLSYYLLVLSLNACAQKAGSFNSVAKMGWLAGTWQGTYQGQPSKDDHWLAVIQNPKNVIKYDLVRVDWLDKYVNNFIAKMSGAKRSP